MPQLDYMVLADYVRQDNGVIHIMGAGVDTITTPVTPFVQPLGVALRISFGTTEQAGEEHQLTVTFSGPDQPILSASARFSTPPRPPGVPEHWRTAAGVALQIAVPLPSHGDYSCEVNIDDGAISNSIDFRVIEPGQIAQPGQAHS
jgi:hypothetical protein